MIFRALVLSLSLLAFGVAQVPDAAPPAAADFTDALGQLAALAEFPLDDRAVWIRLPGRDDNRELTKIQTRVKGNGWSFPAADGATMTLARGATTVGESAGNRELAAVDLTADVETLIKNIHGQRARADDDYDVRWMRDGGDAYGILLLLAAQIHQAGHPAEANRLVAAVFQAAPTRQGVVDAAIQSIAEVRYTAITNAFFESFDWVAYHKALEELSERFPRGWSTRTAVAMFLPQLAKQAAGEPPPTVKIDGAQLDPRALAAIADLAKPAGESAAASVPGGMDPRYAQLMAQMGGSGRGGISRGVWVLKDADGAPGGPVDRLTALGMDAVPTLAALTEDLHLLPMPNAGISGYHGFYYSSRESAADRVLRTYRSMFRPTTRGEIAIRLLAETIPDPDTEIGDADGATVRELAMAFWNEHKDSSRDELALAFATGGSDQQRSEAIDIVAASTDPVIQEQFEKALLAADSMVENIESVNAYVRHRKTAARAFVTEFTKRLRDELATMDPDDLPWQFRQRGGIEGILKSLNAQVEGLSPRAIARDIGRGDPDEAEEALATLRPMLHELEPRPALHALLEGAFAAKDATVRSLFLNETFRIDWDPDEDEDEDTDNEEEPAPERTVSEAEAGVWKKLIADKREFPAEGWARHGITTVGQLAALAMESSIQPGFHFLAVTAAAVTKQDPAEAAMARAAARHSGKPVPPLPSGENVAPERLAAIIAEAATKPPAEIHSYLDALTADERMAWFEWLDGTEDPAVPEAVIEAGRRVVRRGEFLGWGPNFIDLPGAGGIDIGFTIDREALSARLDDLAANADNHSRTSVWLTRGAFPPGLEVIAIRPEIPAESDDEEEDDDDDDSSTPDPAALLVSVLRALNAAETADAAVHIAIFTTDARAEAVWLRTDGTVAAADSDDASKFFETVDGAFASGRNIPLRLQIQVITRADAERLNQD